jgi:DNA phosphorothioation-dependent restriction protein DptG
MENIEQLQQNNAKLQERLNNAAKFFREQKAQIESLTKENEELKNQINRTPQEEIISTEDWNKLVTEKENLKDVAANNKTPASSANPPGNTSGMISNGEIKYPSAATIAAICGTVAFFIDIA